MLWSRLNQWQTNLEQKVTRETYLKICEQTGEEIDPDKIPPEFDDFPPDVQKAILVYNKLGDRMQAQIGYLGKDYTALPLYIEIHEPDNREIFLETLLRLDEVLIKKSQEAMRQEHEKLKAKMGKR